MAPLIIEFRAVCLIMIVFVLGSTRNASFPDFISNWNLIGIILLTAISLFSPRCRLC
jgi:hypothetical protein